MDINDLRSLVTVLSFLCFIGICVWAYSRAAKPAFEEAARLRDEVKRLEAVELTIADDPLARQQAVQEAAEAAVVASGRSTAGRAGQRGGNKRSKRRG